MNFRVVFEVEEFAEKECGEIVRYMEKDKTSRIIGETLGVDRLLLSKAVTKKAGQVVRGSIPLTEHKIKLKTGRGKIENKYNLKIDKRRCDE